MEKCPLSGIECNECGYKNRFGICFLNDLLVALDELIEALKGE
jgi:hypothetical protein